MYCPPPEGKPKCHDVKQCPVCGVESLVFYADEDTNVENYIWSKWWQIVEVECKCCTFNLKDSSAIESFGEMLNIKLWHKEEEILDDGESILEISNLS